jgi:hypothetical protein
MSYKQIDDPNNGNRIEVTEENYAGQTFAVHDRTSPVEGGYVQISGPVSGSVVVPAEALGWLREALSKVSEAHARRVRSTGAQHPTQREDEGAWQPTRFR